MNIGEVVGPPAASAVKGSADESPICDMFEISSVKAPVSDAVMEDHGQIKATLAAGINVAGKGSGPSIVLSVSATKVPQTTVEIFDAFKPEEADCWRAIFGEADQRRRPGNDLGTHEDMVENLLHR